MGHAYSINNSLVPDEDTGETAYGVAIGVEWKGEQLILGQLIFFKPAKTVSTTGKVESTLEAGIFLDYYMRHDGVFSGQYICVKLDDFANKNLH